MMKKTARPDWTAGRKPSGLTGMGVRNPGYPAALGQGGLVAIAVTVLIALVLAATSMTGLSRINATRTVAVKQTLQTYYSAQAGIQEALATRMLPRSNYLNFATGIPAPVEPYYTRSGLVYQDPANQAELIGVYRYVVVGGDAARQSNGNYYAGGSMTPSGIPRLLTTDSIPSTGPFFVISTGTTCKLATGKGVIVPDVINPGVTPTCQAGYVPDALTLVAQVELLRETTPGTPLRDRVVRTMTFKDSSQIRLPAAAFVPGYGWLAANQTIDFDTMYANTTAPNGPVRLKKVVFYNFTDNTIYHEQDINNAQTVIPPANAVPSNSVIRLYFDGPIDYRSIDPGYDRELDGCQGAGAPNCRIRVMQDDPPGNPLNGAGNGGTAYAGNTMIPLFPGSTQVILLPPLTGTISPGGVRHAIKVDATDMRSYSNAPGPMDYTIVFYTQ